MFANAGTGVASCTPLNYRWIAQGLAQKNTPLTALVPDSNPGSSSADNAPVLRYQAHPFCQRSGIHLKLMQGWVVVRRLSRLNRTNAGLLLTNLMGGGDDTAFVGEDDVAVFAHDFDVQMEGGPLDDGQTADPQRAPKELLDCKPPVPNHPTDAAVVG